MITKARHPQTIDAIDQQLNEFFFRSASILSFSTDFVTSNYSSGLDFNFIIHIKFDVVKFNNVRRAYHYSIATLYRPQNHINKAC